jgi:hypothetical protein
MSLWKSRIFTTTGPRSSKASRTNQFTSNRIPAKTSLVFSKRIKPLETHNLHKSMKIGNRIEAKLVFEFPFLTSKFNV